MLTPTSAVEATGQFVTRNRAIVMFEGKVLDARRVDSTNLQRRNQLERIVLVAEVAVVDHL